MLWAEQKLKREKTFVYNCNDFFGDITIETSKRLTASQLDLIQVTLTRGGSCEGDLEIKNEGDIIKLHYKYNKNTKPLWEKVSQEEILKDLTSSTTS